MDVALSRRDRLSSRRIALPTSRTLLLALLLAAAPVAPRAWAAGPPAGPGAKDQAATLAERTKLQGQLDRVNAEIDDLKRRPLGIRDDYRLRSRMADAEALARRLNEIDARLGPAIRAAAPDVAPPEIRVSPSDDRAEREAKADILADQARRLSHEASVLEGRLTTLRARNELKQRSGRLDRDPFAPLEQVKSRVGVNGVASGTATVTDTKTGTSRGMPPATATPGTGTNGATDGAGAAPTAGTPTGTTSAPAGAPLLQPAAPVAAPLSQAAAGDSAGSQLRGVLDPISLEEVRRLEAPGAGPADLQRMERALATLRGRAAQLAAASAALRAHAPSP